jgi:hypothetical protein
MLFRNLTIYQLPPGWARTAAEIEATLTEFPLQACSGLTLQTRGWVPVNDAGQFAYGQDQHVLIAMGSEDKLLPSSVVNQVAGERIAKLENDKGFKLGRKAKREIKEQVAVELTPRAFARRRELRGWFDFKGGWLVVDTASPNRAEDRVDLGGQVGDRIGGRRNIGATGIGGVRNLGNGVVRRAAAAVGQARDCGLLGEAGRIAGIVHHNGLDAVREHSRVVGCECHVHLLK